MRSAGFFWMLSASSAFLTTSWIEMRRNRDAFGSERLTTNGSKVTTPRSLALSCFSTTGALFLAYQNAPAPAPLATTSATTAIIRMELLPAFLGAAAAVSLMLDAQLAALSPRRPVEQPGCRGESVDFGGFLGFSLLRGVVPPD